MPKPSSIQSEAGALCKFGARRYQEPPPPPPPPPPEKPPPPKPLEPLPAGVEATAVEMLEFMDSRLLAIRAAWNGRLPTYQVLEALVSMPSNALAHFVTQPKTIA